MNYHNPEKYQIYFQEGGTYLHKDILALHDYIQFYLLLVMLVVSWLMLVIICDYQAGSYQYGRHRFMILKDFSHGPILEICWTLLPAIILIIIAIPSFQVLYDVDNATRNVLSVKCVGAQWYWTYELENSYGNQVVSYVYDSYMIPIDDLNPGDFRLMEVDMPLIVPYDTYIRLIVTSKDVIHSWSVPSLGIKIDAVPGRLNQMTLRLSECGVYYGACQEICGIQHAFMPIKVKATPYAEFMVDVLAKEITPLKF